MGSNNSGNDKTVQRTEPPKFLEPILKRAVGGLEQTFANPAQYPEYFPRKQQAGFTEAQQEGFARSRQAANQQADVASQTAGAVGDIYGSLDVGSDPYLAGAASAATRPVFQQLRESILPQIRDENIISGTLGGGRQGVAEGQAVGRATQQALDATTRMYADALQDAYENVSRVALGAPSIQAGISAPADTLFQSGGIMQDYNQRLLNDEIARFNYYQNQPFDMAERFWRNVSGMPLGQTQTTNPPDARLSPMVGALGGAATGYGLTREPWGAGAGALAGLILSR